jgi:hypothetical protein
MPGCVIALRRRDSRAFLIGCLPGGRDVPRIRFTLLAVALASTLFSVQATAQALREPNLDLAAPLVGGNLKCTIPDTVHVHIPQPFAARAKLKARLYNLLRESIFDDAKGLVDMKREKEIKDLASKLRSAK